MFLEANPASTLVARRGAAFFSIQRSDFELSETIHVPDEPIGGRVILAFVRIGDQVYGPRPVTSLTITTITTITKTI